MAYNNPYSFHTYKFIRDRLTKDELVSVVSGDTPGYLSQKIDDISIQVNEELKLEVNSEHIYSIVSEYFGLVSTKTVFIYARAVQPPTTPTGEDPTDVNYGDWQDAPYEYDSDSTGELFDFLWMSSAEFVGDSLEGTWSTPVKLSSRNGLTVIQLFKKTSNDTPPSTPTTDDPTIDEGWDIDFNNLGLVEGDRVWMTQSLVSGYTDNQWSEAIDSWSVPYLWSIVGNEEVKYIFKRAQYQPSAPTVVDPIPTSPTYGDWQGSPYSANEDTHRLWVSVATVHGNNLIHSWSDPVSLDATSPYISKRFIFKASDTPLNEAQYTPTGVEPTGWYDSPDVAESHETEGTPVYVSMATIISFSETGTEELIGSWSVPYRISPKDGDAGPSGQDVIDVRMSNTPHNFVFDSDGNIDGSYNSGKSHVQVSVGPAVFENSGLGTDNPTEQGTYSVTSHSSNNITYSTSVETIDGKSQFVVTPSNVPQSDYVELVVVIYHNEELHTYTIRQQYTRTISGIAPPVRVEIDPRYYTFEYEAGRSCVRQYSFVQTDNSYIWGGGTIATIEFEKRGQTETRTWDWNGGRAGFETLISDLNSNPPFGTITGFLDSYNVGGTPSPTEPTIAFSFRDTTSSFSVSITLSSAFSAEAWTLQTGTFQSFRVGELIGDYSDGKAAIRVTGGSTQTFVATTTNEVDPAEGEYTITEITLENSLLTYNKEIQDNNLVIVPTDFGTASSLSFDKATITVKYQYNSVIYTRTLVLKYTRRLSAEATTKVIIETQEGSIDFDELLSDLNQSVEDLNNLYTILNDNLTSLETRVTALENA